MKPRIDLLEKLSAELRAFEPNGLEFDMSQWKRTIRREHGCRTECCAMGLGMERIPEFLTVFEFVPQGEHEEGDNCLSWEVRLKGNTDDPANFRSLDYIIRQLAIGFDISSDEAEDLFAPNTYHMRTSDVTPVMVADRIDAVVEKYKNIELSRNLAFDPRI